MTVGINYYILDVETTGLSCGYQEITEISLIRCIDKVQIFRKIKCDYPERASLDSLRITNKTMEDLLVGSDRFFTVEEINKFFEKDNSTPNARCIVGHNVSFDRRFVHAMWEPYGLEFPAHIWLDTIPLVNDFLKTADHSQLKIKKTATGKISKKLHDACDMIGVKRMADAHNASSDTKSTFFLWKKLIEEKNIDHLPHHKTFIHKIKKDDGLLDINDLDMSDVID